MATTWWMVALVAAGCGGAGAVPSAPAAAVTNEAAASTFELDGVTWLLDGVVGERGERGNVQDASGRTFWVTRYEDGAGPIDLANAREIMTDGAADAIIRLATDGEGGARYELVASDLAMTAGTMGERLIDDPRGDGSTILCAFEVRADAPDDAWRVALEVCRTLHPAAP